MSPKANPRRKRQRTHSLGGCGTCRRRHVKCDQVQPSCLACRAVGLECEGYAAKIQWMPSLLQPQGKKELGAQISGVDNKRRHLYTEDARASMSNALTAELVSQPINVAFSHINRRSRDPHGLAQEDVTVGPFRVFSLTGNDPETAEEPIVYTQDPNHQVHRTEIPSEVPEATPPTATPPTAGSFTDVEDLLQWADLFELGFGETSGCFQDQISFPDANYNNYNTPPMLLATQVDTLEPEDQTTEKGNAAVFLDSAQDQSNEILELDILLDAQALLKHFQDHVIPHMMPAPVVPKSPWKLTMLATAVQTLSEITYLQYTHVKYARLANLYGVLALSSYHMYSTASGDIPFSAEKCRRIYEVAALKGKVNLQESFRTEVNGPQKAKYKDQLMAILCMIALSVITGQGRQARCYMIDAERLLRVRGLAKPIISRKARLLHHVYTWLRIVGETTFTIHDYKSYAPMIETFSAKQQKRFEARGSGNEERGDDTTQLEGANEENIDDFLSFGGHPEDSDLDIDQQKEQNVGLHDIHLKDSRDHVDTMYMQLYGVPEMWLSLISQTTRLANVMSILDTISGGGYESFREILQRRAARLEDLICSFASKTSSNIESIQQNEPDYAGSSSSSTSLLTESMTNKHMLRALSSSLVIFFYRRIRHVNPLILQGHVDDVIIALQALDKSLEMNPGNGVGTAWPAFIAGCEATSQKRRIPLLEFIEKRAAVTGFHGYQAAVDLMKKLWLKREEGGGSSASKCSWVQISKENNFWLMLC